VNPLTRWVTTLKCEEPMGPATPHHVLTSAQPCRRPSRLRDGASITGQLRIPIRIRTTCIRLPDLASSSSRAGLITVSGFQLATRFSSQPSGSAPACGRWGTTGTANPAIFTPTVALSAARGPSPGPFPPTPVTLNVSAMARGLARPKPR
jgi:hypothetical protein